MILMQNISLYPKENAETTANLLLSYLFMWRRESDEAEAQFIEKYRQKFLAENGGAR